MIWAHLLMLACRPGGIDSTPAVEDTSSSLVEDSAFQPFVLSGVVVEPSGSPVPGATVLIGGLSSARTLSESDGSFTLSVDEPPPGTMALVAGKLGYRAIGVEYFDAEQPQTLTLRPIEGPDNLDYSYQEPGDGHDSSDETCSHCHTRFVRDFRESKHAEAASNPKLHDLYVGAANAWSSEQACSEVGGSWETGAQPGQPGSSLERCYVDAGVLADLNPQCAEQGCDDPDLSASDAPTAFGACADCHAPGIEGAPGGRDLHEAQGLAYTQGVHCDVCHKVASVDLEAEPGVAGRLVLSRPSEPGSGIFEWDPVYYGPLVDVPNVAMAGSVQPQFDQAVFCAGCHEQQQPALLPGESLDAERWPDGLPIHSTYSEWLAGPYAEREMACQSCHMPGDPDANNAVDISTYARSSITFGFPRDPSDVRRHSFLGPLSGPEPLLADALHLELVLTQDGDELVAQVGVSNIGAGHAIPTGEPMRALLLTLQAQGSCGELQAVDGPTLPAEAGFWLRGVVGEEVLLGEEGVDWPTAQDWLAPGMVLRITRPSEETLAYNAPIADLGEGRGLPLERAVGQFVLAGGEIPEIPGLQEGDVLTLSPAAAWDGAIQPLAGSPGQHFAKVLLDPEGERMVPHHRAVDIAWDNRIPPGSYQVSTHRFALPEGCSDPELSAALIYRPHPWALAETYGWEALDTVVLEKSAPW